MNALEPIVVTLLGIIILAKATQSRNAPPPILVKLSLVGSVTLVKAEQPLNAYAPILVTDDGMVMLVSLEQL